MRWVRKNRTIYELSRCTLCGTFWGDYPERKCPRVVCPVCGSAQCWVNGLGHGTCGICLVGLLPGWAGNDADCSRKQCQNLAEARVGSRHYCLEHLPAKARQQVAEQLEKRSIEREEVEDDIG